MKDYLLTPEEALRTPMDESRGNLSFGQRMWMPAVDISGNSYSVAYEDVSEEHLKGIPLRHEGRLIGHVEIVPGGENIVTLLEGESLPIPEEKVNVSVRTLGIAPSCEAAVLNQVADSLDAFNRANNGTLEKFRKHILRTPNKRIAKKKYDLEEDFDNWFRYYVTLASRINTDGIDSPDVKEFFEKMCKNLKRQRNRIYKSTRKSFIMKAAYLYSKDFKDFYD